MEQTQNISDERLEELIAEIEKDIARWPESNKAKAHEVFAEDLSVLRELIQARSDLADVEDLLPAPAGPYQTMGERTKLLKDQGEYAQEMCGDAVKLLEAAQDKFTALRASHKRLADVLEEIERHHLGLNRAKGRPANHSHTLRLCAAALAEARKLEGK